MKVAVSAVKVAVIGSEGGSERLVKVAVSNSEGDSKY